MEQTLVLNATYEPIKVVDWQRAITLWCQGKVEILDTHDREVRAVTFSFRLPSIVRLLRFVKVKRMAGTVPFTRANIYRRDHHQCQYCGDTFRSEDLTFDHVIPEAHGGRKSWENIVAACMPCNRRKDARTPTEARMPLLRAPKKPAPAPVFHVTLYMKRTPESWRDYLYWNVELESDLS
jgi:5-methylcytosine-specific restriction endonuclease McrA